MADVVVGAQREPVTVTRRVEAFYWRCEGCGWLGTGWLSIEGATNEAAEHCVKVHGLVGAEVQRVDWGGRG